MAAKSGANTGIILRPYLTFGSPGTPGANDKMRVDSDSFKRNSQELKEATIGGQIVMQRDSDIGDDDPGGSITKTLRTDDAFIGAIMNFFGTETVTNPTATVYEHSAAFNATSNVNYFLYAKETGTAAVAEYVDAIMTKWSLEANPNQYVKTTGDFIGSKRLITGTTSSNANIAAATEPTNANFVFRDTDYFMINAQAGAALSTGTDVLAVTSVKVNFERPQDFVAEAKNVAGKSAPRVDGEYPFIGSIEVTLKEKPDDTYETAFDAGTEFKAQLKVSGTTISGAFKYSFRLDLPRLKPVLEPDYSLNSPKVNPYVIKFTCLAASSAPTGMASVYPFACVTNTRAVKYLL